MASEIQHITYNEFLPTLLGQKVMNSFELSLKGNGYHMGYNDDLPMTTLNSVANAILPLFLSLLPPAISFSDSVIFLYFIHDTAMPPYYAGQGSNVLQESISSIDFL